MQEPLKIPNEAQVTVLACLIVIIVMANTVVIRVILVRKLMNITSMFIIAISVSNILIGPVMISLEVSRLLADASLSAMGCHFIVYFEMTCFTANMYTLMVFIVDMYRTIIVKYRRTYSRIRVVVAILLVWAASFIFATKSFVHLNNGDTSCSHRDQSAGKENGTHGYVNNTRACEEGDDKNDDSDDISENIMCSYLMEESEGDIVSRYVDLVVILIIPQAVCTVCMVKMRYRLWSHELGLNRTLRQRRKLVKLLCGLLTANITCWMPLLMSDILVDTSLLNVNSEEAEEVQSSYSLKVVKFIFVILAFISLSLNPFFMTCLSDRTSSDILFLDACCPNLGKAKVHPAGTPSPSNRTTFTIKCEIFAVMTDTSNNNQLVPSRTF